MKKIIHFIFLLFPAVLVMAQGITMDEVRKMYAASAKDKEVCGKLYNRLSAKEHKDNLMTGYYGAISANMANHAKEPKQKVKYFNQGKRLLEQAIQTDSLNSELRFLRFTIQTNCPKALHYDKSIEADKKFLISHLETQAQPGLQKKIALYLSGSPVLTEEEKTKVNHFLEKKD